MARQKCTFKMKRQKCTFKLGRQKCMFKWQGKSVRLKRFNGKTKVYV